MEILSKYTHKSKRKIHKENIEYMQKNKKCKNYEMEECFVHIPDYFYLLNKL